MNETAGNDSSSLGVICWLWFSHLWPRTCADVGFEHEWFGLHLRWECLDGAIYWASRSLWTDTSMCSRHFQNQSAEALEPSQTYTFQGCNVVFIILTFIAMFCAIATWFAENFTGPTYRMHQSRETSAQLMSGRFTSMFFWVLGPGWKCLWRSWASIGHGGVAFWRVFVCSVTGRMLRNGSPMVSPTNPWHFANAASGRYFEIFSEILGNFGTNRRIKELSYSQLENQLAMAAKHPGFGCICCCCCSSPRRKKRAIEDSFMTVDRRGQNGHGTWYSYTVWHMGLRCWF